MVLPVYLTEVRKVAPSITEAKICHAIKSNKIPRSRLNAAYQFDITESDVQAAIAHFPRSAKREPAAC